MKDFRKLAVWQKAHRLTLKVYEATRKFPREELYGLTGQTEEFKPYSDKYRRRLWPRR